jgi:hypothetical protein
MNSTKVSGLIAGGSRTILIGSKFCGYSKAKIDVFFIFVVETSLNFVMNDKNFQKRCGYRGMTEVSPENQTQKDENDEKNPWSTLI